MHFLLALFRSNYEKTRHENGNVLHYPLNNYENEI
jgi:hypothetical protein